MKSPLGVSLSRSCTSVMLWLVATRCMHPAHSHTMTDAYMSAKLQLPAVHGPRNGVALCSSLLQHLPMDMDACKGVLMREVRQANGACAFSFPSYFELLPRSMYKGDSQHLELVAIRPHSLPLPFTDNIALGQTDLCSSVRTDAWLSCAKVCAACRSKIKHTPAYRL